MVFDQTVKLGDLLTSISVLVATLALGTTWIKDRNLRRKEYADRIRRAAAETAVALQRWKELSLRLYDDIQPLITDADMLLVQEQDVIKVRDFLWRGIVAARADSSRRILNEKIETAYVGLYGYHPSVQATYNATVDLLIRAQEGAFNDLLYSSQNDVLALTDLHKPFESAQLGNSIRSTAAYIAQSLNLDFESILSPFQGDMLRLIELSDAKISEKEYVGKGIDTINTMAIVQDRPPSAPVEPYVPHGEGCQ